MIIIAYFTLEGYNSYSGCDIVVTASLPKKISDADSNNYYTLGSLQTLSVSTHQDKRPVRSLGNINAKEYVMGPRTIAGSLVFAVFDRHFATEIMEDLGGSIMPDEIPALNFTINMMNEYGRKSRMAIYGAKIINEGQVMSINDLYTENTYQFVALGMEVLTNDVDNNYLETRNKQSVILAKDSEAIAINDPKDVLIKLPPSGKTVANRMLNNAAQLEDKNSNTDIILSVDVEQPITKDDMGVATFTVKGATEAGTIFVNNGSGSVNLYRISTTASRKSYDKELPVGYYSAIYKSVSNKESNEVKFHVYVKSDEDKKPSSSGSYLPNNDALISVVSSYDKHYLPVIEGVTDTTIKVRNNTAFSHIHYYSEGTEIKKQELGYKNTVLLENLKPNTLYYIYMSENEVRSLTAKVKTHATIEETLEILKITVEANKEIVSTDKDELLNELSRFSMKDYESLIDLILNMEESTTKQELLIYSEVISNDLLKEYNRESNNFIVEIEQGTPFDSESKYTGADELIVYRNAGKKSYYAETVDSSQNNFCTKPNIRYSIYGENNLSNFVRRDYVICKHYAYDNLINYCDVNVYKKLDLTATSSSYQITDNDLILFLAIKDSNKTDTDILQEPFIYIEDNVVYADVYYPFLEQDKEYYLVVSEIYKALDYCPKRKIKFTNEANIINLNSNYCGVIEEEIYLVWIEDSNCKKISQSTLFIPNKKDVKRASLDKINDELVLQDIGEKKAKFLSVYDNKSIADDVFTIVKSKDVPLKNINTALISELISVCEKTYFESNVLTALALLVASLFEFNNKVYINMQINKEEKQIIYNEKEDDAFKIFALLFDEEEDENFIRIKNENNTFSYGYSGYTIVFICDKYSEPLAFFVLDNLKNKYIYYNMSKIEEV